MPEAVGLRARSLYAWLDHEPARAARLAVLPRVVFEINPDYAWLAPIDAIDSLLAPGAAALIRHRLEEAGWSADRLIEEFPFLTDPFGPMRQAGALRYVQALDADLRRDLCVALDPELGAYADGLRRLHDSDDSETEDTEVLLPRESVISARLDSHDGE
jgi:hypothetical protein